MKKTIGIAVMNFFGISAIIAMLDMFVARFNIPLFVRTLHPSLPSGLRRRVRTDPGRRRLHPARPSPHRRRGIMPRSRGPR